MQHDFHSNPIFVQDGPTVVTMLIGDAQIPFGRFGGVTVAEEIGEGPTLSNRVDGNEENVRKKRGRTVTRCSLRAMDFLDPKFKTWWRNRGVPPTIDQKYRLRCECRIDAFWGEEKQPVKNVAGIVQAYDTTIFPAPTSPAGADSGAGTLTDQTDYHLYVVHAYLNTDVGQHGIDPDVDFTLANLGNLVVGRDYVLGRPSAASAAITTTGGSSAIAATWVDAVIPAGSPTPDKTIVFLSENGPTLATVAKASAVVDFGTLAATVTAVGTVDYNLGAAAAVGDYHRHYEIGVTAEARTWTLLTEDTDYEFDTVKGMSNRLDAGTVNDGADMGRAIWYVQAPTLTYDGSGSGVTEKYVELLIENVDSDGTDPDTRRGTGSRCFLHRVNIAEVGGALMTSGDEGFHPGSDFAFEALRDPTKGRAYTIDDFSPEFANFVDTTSGDIAAVNA